MKNLTILGCGIAGAIAVTFLSPEGFKALQGGLLVAIYTAVLFRV